MRVIKETDIVNAVRDMCIEANKILPASLENLINDSPNKEDNELGKAILCDICKYSFIFFPPDFNTFLQHYHIFWHQDYAPGRTLFHPPPKAFLAP